MTALTITNGRVNQTSTAILNRKGLEVGTKYELGTGAIAACRKQLRESGLTANEASKKIAEFLKGSGGNLQWAQAQTLLEAARAKGQFATTFELREKSFCLRGGVAPKVKGEKAVTVAKAVKDAPLAELNAAMAERLGITVEAYEAMIEASVPATKAPVEV